MDKRENNSNDTHNVDITCRYCVVWDDAMQYVANAPKRKTPESFSMGWPTILRAHQQMKCSTRYRASDSSIESK